jgi:hypothetical protein
VVLLWEVVVRAARPHWGAEERGRERERERERERVRIGYKPFALHAPRHLAILGGWIKSVRTTLSWSPSGRLWPAQHEAGVY